VLFVWTADRLPSLFKLSEPATTSTNPAIPSDAGERAALQAAKQQIEDLRRELAEARQVGQGGIRSDDISIQVDLWSGIQSNLFNALIGALNEGFEIQSNWRDMIPAHKYQLIEKITNFRQHLQDANGKLQELASEYRRFSDLSDALLPPNGPRIIEIVDNLYSELNSLPEPLPPDYDSRIRPLSGALKRELDSTVSWIKSSRETATQKLQVLGKN
jgi:hypothetical protein